MTEMFCEIGLGKQSRSLFMEIDAKVSSQPTPTSPMSGTPKKNLQNPWPPTQKEVL